MDDLSTAAEPIDAASATYLGRWHRLVSTTNWEKGRIIHEWRQALIEARLSPAEYSDDAWSRHVGGVSGQHVGRLRRVYERFGQVYQDYNGLFWSHFQAAIDWNDAEMWLEGAIQSHWSVAEMRRERWAAFGGEENSAPIDSANSPAELDDAAGADWQRPVSLSNNSDEHHAAVENESRGDHEHRTASGYADETSAADHDAVAPLGPSDLSAADGASERSSPATPFRPFADLPPLPEDVNDAFESFKLAILRHKSAGWREVSCNTLLQCLDGLQALATAPA